MDWANVTFEELLSSLQEVTFANVHTEVYAQCPHAVPYCHSELMPLLTECTDRHLHSRTIW